MSEYASGVNVPRTVVVTGCTVHAAKAVKAAEEAAGRSLDITGTVYITGKFPDIDEILNLGINSYVTCVMRYVINRVAVFIIGNRLNVGIISIL